MGVRSLVLRRGLVNNRFNIESHIFFFLRFTQWNAASTIIYFPMTLVQMKVINKFMGYVLDGI